MGVLSTIIIKHKSFFVALLLAFSATPAIAESLPEKGTQSTSISTAAKDISITVYNQNFGLVRDVRDIVLKEGRNHIEFDDVAAGIDPTSVSFVSLTSPNAVAVREQNYQFDLMDLKTVLARSVGKQVKFKQQLPGGGERIIEGELISAPGIEVANPAETIVRKQGAVVIKTAGGIILQPQGDIELAELPAGLVAKPQLMWQLDCDKAGEQRAEISYQTKGLDWKCDYVAIANDKDSAVDLTSWVTLDNKSGASYSDASLKLIAGDVHKIVDESSSNGYAMQKWLGADASLEQFTEESFAEYHLYSLAGKTDLHDNETKQLTLFQADSVPVKKLYIYEPVGLNRGIGSPIQREVMVKLELANTRENNLGMAMPKGIVRVYKRDKDDALQFAGEDKIDHTPRDEKVRLLIGNAFDLVGERTVTLQTDVSKKVKRLSYLVSLRNHKQEPVTITYIGREFGDSKVIDSSMKYTKTDSSTFEFTVPVAKDGESKITYTVETRWP